MEASNLLAAVSERFRSAPSYKLEFAGIFKISKWLETARLLQALDSSVERRIVRDY